MMVELLEHKFWVAQLRKRVGDQQMINDAMHKLHKLLTEVDESCSRSAAAGKRKN